MSEHLNKASLAVNEEKEIFSEELLSSQKSRHLMLKSIAHIQASSVVSGVLECQYYLHGVVRYNKGPVSFWDKS